MFEVVNHAFIRPQVHLKFQAIAALTRIIVFIGINKINKGE